MRIFRLAAVLAVLVLNGHLAAAQQPAPPQERSPGGLTGGVGMKAHLRMMDSLNARLDTLVRRMNRAKGDRKVTAMADVINELVAQRKVTHAHMREMMESRQGMMHMKGMMGDPTPGAPPTPPPGTDSMSADTAGHAEHHPSK